jgi:hypothetical protein
MTPAHALSISDNCTTPLPVISPFGVKFIDPDEPEEEQVSKAEAEEEISGK